MKVKRLFLLLFCSVFALCLFIGSGFSAFFFSNGASIDDGQVVDVKAESQLELGNVILLSDTGNIGYQVFLGTDQVYMIRKDNPTREAEFSVRCDLSSAMDLSAEYTVALACDVTIQDPDARGVKKADGEEYFYSASMLDYIAPVRALTNAHESDAFAVIARNDRSITYRCVLAEDVPTSSGEPYFLSGITLKFKYEDYEARDNVHIFSGSMTPSSQYGSPESYGKVMAATQAAYDNAEITVIFRLILMEVG